MKKKSKYKPQYRVSGKIFVEKGSQNRESGFLSVAQGIKFAVANADTLGMLIDIKRIMY
jgi:hypothetical protein